MSPVYIMYLTFKKHSIRFHIKDYYFNKNRMVRGRQHRKMGTELANRRKTKGDGGVPRGSILGTLLFYYFLPHLYKQHGRKSVCSGILTFADDTDHFQKSVDTRLHAETVYCILHGYTQKRCIVFYTATRRNGVLYFKFFTESTSAPQVLARDADTEVTVTGPRGSSTELLAAAGDFFLHRVTSSETAWLSATRQVLAVQFAVSQTTPDDGSAPAALLLPPSEQWQNDYAFTTATASAVYVTAVVAETHSGGVTLDGVPLGAGADWQPVNGADGALVYAHVVVTPSVAHRLRHPDAGVLLAAYLYGFTPGDCAFARPAGMMLQDIDRVSQCIMRFIIKTIRFEGSISLHFTVDKCPLVS